MTPTLDAVFTLGLLVFGRPGGCRRDQGRRRAIVPRLKTGCAATGQSAHLRILPCYKPTRVAHDEIAMHYDIC